MKTNVQGVGAALHGKVLDAQINYIRGMGVEFQTGVTIGKDGEDNEV